jgi:hypothetical protein
MIESGVGSAERGLLMTGGDGAVWGIQMASPVKSATPLSDYIGELEAEVVRLREALEPYADHSCWGVTRRFDGSQCVEFLVVNEAPWTIAEAALAKGDEVG